MTNFAIKIWTWELAGQATALTLVGFFGLVPSILIAPLAGVIVDRFSRKLLILVGDIVAAIATLTILLLYLTHHLQIWHLYLISAFSGALEQLQGL